MHRFLSALLDARGRWITGLAILLLFALAATRFALSQDLPHAKLSATQRSVEKVSYPLWRHASDLLGARKYAVLTFDDGPYGSGVDERILKILSRHRAHAMFFVVCNRLGGDGARILAEIKAGGHVIENHSWDHLHLNKMDAKGLRHQIEHCSADIADLTGQRPRYFRPPFGETSVAVRQAAEDAGMSQMLWNANSQDSWQKRPEQILYWTREQTADDSILLLHDSPTTAAVLDRVLSDLESRGFRFVLPEAGSPSALSPDIHLPAPAK